MYVGVLTYNWQLPQTIEMEFSLNVNTCLAKDVIVNRIWRTTQDSELFLLCTATEWVSDERVCSEE